MELALTLTVLGIGTVLIILYVISLMIRVMGKLFQGKKIPDFPVLAAATPVPAVSAEDDSELIALISAAVAACMDAPGKLTMRPYTASGSTWTTVSRIENTNH